MNTVKKPDGRRNNGGHANSGRKSRAELGLEPVQTTTIDIEPSIKESARKLFGSLANAIRWAVKSKT